MTEPLCHNNKVLHENTHMINFAIYTKLIFFQTFYKYANFSHEVYVDFKKESILR